MNVYVADCDQWVITVIAFGYLSVVTIIIIVTIIFARSDIVCVLLLFRLPPVLRMKLTQPAKTQPEQNFFPPQWCHCNCNALRFFSLRCAFIAIVVIVVIVGMVVIVFVGQEEWCWAFCFSMTIAPLTLKSWIDKQVTRVDDIVADGWARASNFNLHSILPSPPPNSHRKHLKRTF